MSERVYVRACVLFNLVLHDFFVTYYLQKTCLTNKFIFNDNL